MPKRKLTFRTYDFKRRKTSVFHPFLSRDIRYQITCFMDAKELVLLGLTCKEQYYLLEKQTSCISKSSITKIFRAPPNNRLYSFPCPRACRSKIFFLNNRLEHTSFWEIACSIKCALRYPRMIPPGFQGSMTVAGSLFNCYQCFTPIPVKVLIGELRGNHLIVRPFCYSCFESKTALPFDPTISLTKSRHSIFGTEPFKQNF